jgi:hypothetical protein
MTIVVVVLVGLLGVFVGYLVRDAIVEWPRPRRGGQLDFTGSRPRQPDPWLERSRPFLYLVPPAETTRLEPGVRHDSKGRSFYSSAWLDQRDDREDRG